MTRADLEQLRETWNKRLFDINGDLLGSVARGKYRLKGKQRDRAQAQCSTLQTCISELGAILDKPL